MRRSTPGATPLAGTPFTSLYTPMGNRGALPRVHRGDDPDAVRSARKEIVAPVFWKTLPALTDSLRHAR